MERRLAWLRCVLVFSLASTVVLGAFVAPARAGTGYRVKLLRMVNAARQKRDLHTLKIDPSLTKDAMRHTRRMLARDAIFDPQSLAKMLEDEPWDDIGASVVGCAESLYKLHRAWMEHRAHRVILLNPKLRRIGIGVIKEVSTNACGKGSFWATELFYG